MKRWIRGLAGSLLALGLAAPAAAQTAATPQEAAVLRGLKPVEGDYVVHGFRFHSGETLPELKLHYRTLGTPRRDAAGHVANAVLVLHGTGGSGRQFLGPQFAGELFGPGQPLDAARYFIVLPDGIGHGQSSKPSDGLRAAFPHYDYDDMVAAQHALLVDGLHVDHLRLAMGTSMGCMHSFVWGERYPGFADALMPLACMPMEIAGRNRMWRKMLMDAIQDDPAWQGGNYASEPQQGLRTAADFLLIAGGAPQRLQQEHPTGAGADAFLAQQVPRLMQGLDANDLLYQVAASRGYDPKPGLASIAVPVMWVNSGDDFINPPTLQPIAAQLARQLPRGRFVVIPASEATHGHGTHTWAALWKSYLVELLQASEKAAP